MTVDAIVKIVFGFAVALTAIGCTIGRLHVDVIDMNDVETLNFEDAPTKPAAQVDFKWDF